MRVAVIEVGSRSTRLLVAEAVAGKLVTIAAGVVNLDLMRALKTGDLTVIAELEDVLSQFRRKALASDAQKMAVIGTEAVRRLTELIGPGVLQGIEVLDPRDEAYCSLVAAIRGIPTIRPDSTVCVIDHGNGSLELAVGKAGAPVEMSEFVSLPLGSDRLLSVLANCKSNVSEFSAWAFSELDVVPLPKMSLDAIVIQGSVSTKCAWLRVRQDLSEAYDPKKVHGHTMYAQNLRNLISTVENRPPSAWSALSQVVNPKDKPSDQIQRLVTGCVVLERLLSRLNQTDFLVGAYGTRFGMAWRLADGSDLETMTVPA